MLYTPACRRLSIRNKCLYENKIAFAEKYSLAMTGLYFLQLAGLCLLYVICYSSVGWRW